jgi:bifunctional non-homologous end joining protein LigD
MPLPTPMLATPGVLPRGAAWAYEVKWDGFRAIVSSENGLEIRSRRGWSMTDRLPELAALPTGLVLDGELVAIDDDGRPSFPLLVSRLLHRRPAIPVTFVVFDVLHVEDHDTMCLPYDERRALLEALDLNGPAWQTPDTFDDGPALLASIIEQGLEGVVAKRRESTYRPGERGWIKAKNRAYWRYGQGWEARAAPDRRRPWRAKAGSPPEGRRGR